MMDQHASAHLDVRTASALRNIDFLSRYKQLSGSFKYDLNERFKSFSNSEVVAIFEQMGYEVTYEKSENFFKLLESVNQYEFQFNFVLKNGIAEFIFSLREDGIRIPFGGGTWGAIAENLGEEEPIRLPIFRNYGDLRSILFYTLGIYVDFKKELVRKKG